MISPSGRVPEWGLDWFLVATGPCGGETSDLGLFLMVSLFIGFFWRRFHAKMGLEVSTTHRGTLEGPGLPRWVVVTLRPIFA